MGDKNIILANTQDTGEAVALNPRLKYGALELIAVAALAGVGGYYLKGYRAAKSGKDLSREDIDALIAEIRKDDLDDAELLSIVKSLNLADVFEKVKTNEALLSQISERIKGLNNGSSGTSLDEISNKLAEIERLLAGKSGAEDIDLSEITDQVLELKNLMTKTFEYSGTDGITRNLDVQEALKLVLDAVLAPKDAVLPSEPESIDFDELKQAIMGADMSVNLAMIFEKLTSSVSLTSADSGTPWYELLTEDEKFNLGKLIEDKKDGISFVKLTAATIEDSLKGLSSGLSFPFTVSTLDTDNLHENGYFKHKNNMLIRLFMGRISGVPAIATETVVGTDKNYTESTFQSFGVNTSDKIRQGSHGSLLLHSLEPVTDKAVMKVLKESVTANEEYADNSFISLATRVSARNEARKFVVENKDKILNALNQAQNSRKFSWAGFVYAFIMASHGIAQRPGNGSRTAWNDFETSIKASKLLEKATVSTFNKLLDDGHYNTLVYALVYLDAAFFTLTTTEDLSKVL